MQDTEDSQLVEYTAVVKLTTGPSEMHVVGSSAGNFKYGPQEGAAGCFISRCFHESVEPDDASEHLKVEC